MRHRRLRAGMAALMVTVLAGGSAAGQEAEPSPSTVGLWVSLTTTEELPANGWDQATLGRILAAESTTATVETRETRETVETLIPTREIVVAADSIDAGDTLTEEVVMLRTVVVDETYAHAYGDAGDVVGAVAAIDVLPNQPITPNLLESWTSGVGSAVVALETGEVLSTHCLEPARSYWRNQRRDPGRWPGSQATR